MSKCTECKVKASSQYTIKPWGAEFIWAETEHYVGKILFINQGKRFSLQHHEQKDETLIVNRGLVKVYYGPSLDSLRVIILKEKDSIHFPPGTLHRMEAIIESEVYEASTPELKDVVRHEDDYGRN